MEATFSIPLNLASRAGCGGAMWDGAEVPVGTTIIRTKKLHSGKTCSLRFDYGYRTHKNNSIN